MSDENNRSESVTDALLMEQAADQHGAIPTHAAEDKNRSEQDVYSESRDWDIIQQKMRLHDEDMIKGLTDDIDTLLTFAGLFSAALTAFLVLVISQLQVDNGQLSAQLLSILVLQNGARDEMIPFLNATASSLPSSASFDAASTSVAVNTLWFVSLVLSLSAALFGILVKQWCREYLRWYSPLSDARDNVSLRQLRYDAWYEWKVPSIVVWIPSLLELALILYFVGLSVYSWTLQRVVFIFVTVLVGIVLLVTFVMTILPVISRLCPYKSPTGWLFVGLSRLLDSSRHFLIRRGEPPEPVPSRDSWRSRDFLCQTESSLGSGLKAAVVLGMQILRHVTNDVTRSPELSPFTRLQDLQVRDLLPGYISTESLIRGLAWVRRESHDADTTRAVDRCIVLVTHPPSNSQSNLPVRGQTPQGITVTGRLEPLPNRGLNTHFTGMYLRFKRRLWYYAQMSKQPQSHPIASTSPSLDVLSNSSTSAQRFWRVSAQLLTSFPLLIMRLGVSRTTYRRAAHGIHPETTPLPASRALPAGLTSVRFRPLPLESWNQRIGPYYLAASDSNRFLTDSERTVVSTARRVAYSHVSLLVDLWTECAISGGSNANIFAMNVLTDWIARIIGVLKCVPADWCIDNKHFEDMETWSASLVVIFSKLAPHTLAYATGLVPIITELLRTMGHISIVSRDNSPAILVDMLMPVEDLVEGAVPEISIWSQFLMHIRDNADCLLDAQHAIHLQVVLLTPALTAVRDAMFALTAFQRLDTELAHRRYHRRRIPFNGLRWDVTAKEVYAPDFTSFGQLLELMRGVASIARSEGVQNCGAYTEIPWLASLVDVLRVAKDSGHVGALFAEKETSASLFELLLVLAELLENDLLSGPQLPSDFDDLLRIIRLCARRSIAQADSAAIDHALEMQPDHQAHADRDVKSIARRWRVAINALRPAFVAESSVGHNNGDQPQSSSRYSTERMPDHRDASGTVRPSRQERDIGVNRERPMSTSEDLAATSCESSLAGET